MYVTCTCIKVYYSICTVYRCACTCMCTSGFLISFEAWSKLAQQWLVCQIRSSLGQWYAYQKQWCTCTFTYISVSRCMYVYIHVHGVRGT